MYMPSIFGENLFDDFFNFPTSRTYEAPSQDWSRQLMKTDVQENGENYELAIDLPGFTKEDMKLHLKDGFLTIEAERKAVDQKEEEGKYVRRERFTGKCERTFQVDKDLTEEDIKAKYENGVLTICFPKEVKRPLPEKKYISIEG